MSFDGFSINLRYLIIFLTQRQKVNKALLLILITFPSSEKSHCVVNFGLFHNRIFWIKTFFFLSFQWKISRCGEFRPVPRNPEAQYRFRRKDIRDKCARDSIQMAISIQARHTKGFINFLETFSSSKIPLFPCVNWNMKKQQRDYSEKIPFHYIPHSKDPCIQLK